jgi:hypothetical protein
MARKLSSRPKGTTRIGFVNSNGQEVMRRREKRGTDYLQYVYVLKCKHCGNEYTVNGQDIQGRRCPHCQDGRPGLPY